MGWRNPTFHAILKSKIMEADGAFLWRNDSKTAFLVGQSEEVGRSLGRIRGVEDASARSVVHRDKTTRKR